MKNKISVIVPVYNVDKYLNRCIESIISQTYKHLEIILINDGSTDNSGTICDFYHKRDSRIKVVHQVNKGLSEARNAGLDIATGDYISFVDSDDYLDKRMFEIILQNSIRENADISICKNNRFSGDEYIGEINVQNRVTQYSTQEALRYLHGLDSPTFTVAWGKLYKSYIFKDLRYPPGKINEDEYVTYKALNRANKIILTEMPLYFYFFNPSGITAHAEYLECEDIYSALKERVQYFLGNNNPEIAAIAYKAYIDRIILRYRKLMNITHIQSNDLKKLRMRYRSEFKERGNQLSRIGHKIIGYQIFYISPNIYFKILELKENFKEKRL